MRTSKLRKLEETKSWVSKAAASKKINAIYVIHAMLVLVSQVAASRPK